MTYAGALHLPASTPLSTDTLFERICVRRPYFALRAPTYAAGRFTAVGPVELPLGGERSPMSAAEVGRHAAIAGLCCAALAQRDTARRYYLAQRAVYQGFGPKVLPSEMSGEVSDEVSFESTLGRLDKRAAVVTTRAAVGGETLAVVEVAYTVLSVPAFERLFRDRVQPVPEAGTGDGYHGELSGETLERSPDRVRVRVARIPLEVCAGHFDGYPAMPVAVLMGQLSRLAGKLMGAALYNVTAGLVEADDLLWAGSEAVFEATRVAREGREHRFSCLVYSAGRIKGRMELTLVEVPTA